MKRVALKRISIALVLSLILSPIGSTLFAADHNDPNSVNSIFSDINVSAADLYDMYGWPSADGKNVILALTFASVPKAGVFDTDMLYRIHINANPRPAPPAPGESWDLPKLLAYGDAVAEKYLHLKGAEVRVRVDEAQVAHVDFINFPSGTFSKTIAMNKAVTVNAPDGTPLQVFVGGRDDAFFNDLPGFFRSINYGPQFYHVPLSASYDDRELKIPKTLLELEGNTLFNDDPHDPNWGRPGGSKRDLPPGPHDFKPTRFAKDANGNYKFVYSGRDAQAGRNINVVIVEIPHRFISTDPNRDRIVNAWGESMVMKAAQKIETIPDNPSLGFFGSIRAAFHRSDTFEQQTAMYKRVDTDGLPFADAALSEREDKRQLGANNIILARTFVIRFGHLGWGFGPSISALGLGTCFDHDNSPVSVYKTYTLAVEAFPRVKKCLFQEVNMPDDSWNPKHLNIPLRRPFEIFIPNVNAVDMDTTGSWPFGRRPEDQVATRFLSIFLDQKAGCGGKPCTLETLGDQKVWDAAPIAPKTPPNPLKNDKPFLDHFPYLADPW
jgi:hypothetical protein